MVLGAGAATGAGRPSLSSRHGTCEGGTASLFRAGPLREPSPSQDLPFQALDEGGVRETSWSCVQPAQGSIGLGQCSSGLKAHIVWHLKSTLCGRRLVV